MTGLFVNRYLRYMEITVANVAWHTIFCGKPSFVDKQWMEKEFGELSTEEIQEIRDKAVPETTKKP